MEKLQQTVHPSPMPIFSLTDPSWPVLTLLLLRLSGVVHQALVEEGAAGGLLEEVHDGVVDGVAVLVQPARHVVGDDACRGQLYTNRSSRKIDSQRLFSREQDFPKTSSLTEN